jgi:prevent-host-death family protein
MPTKLSSREFNQAVNRAKDAAKRGPVFITDRGKPAHVLLTFEDYQRLSGTGGKIADLLAMPGVEKIPLEISRSRDLPRVPDLS